MGRIVRKNVMEIICQKDIQFLPITTQKDATDMDALMTDPLVTTVELCSRSQLIAVVSLGIILKDILATTRFTTLRLIMISSNALQATKSGMIFANLCLRSVTVREINV